VEHELSAGALRDAGLFAPQVVARLRKRLEAAPEGHLEKVRLELVMMLVLGSQLLHRRFVAAPC
jgi:hypothetical protein